ncbi:ferritin [Saccharopolyspora phatthalungensis]|uniref:Ferritin n=1 Tax=Saccharopolyspora phatthalungensis TaxID=664693 RepID=A0A840Q9Q6_9PSEU|nr:ferritin [Saccharopolyspora phatthalungensis]MBB5157504.1 ferritin [Saccharopolyspora phatthalungensis]
MTGIVKKIEPRTSRAQNLLENQVGNELTVSQQYLAAAVWYDQRDLPRLASYFYRHAVKKRNDAMRIVQYMLDNNIEVEIPGVPAVCNDFSDPRELIALALEQERNVTEEVTTLSRAVREEGDYLGEQFMRWFLTEQVEEVSEMTTMLNVMDRSQGNMFDMEDYLKRDPVGDSRNESMAPSVAGGKL